jgi:hypothetical protein
MVKDVDEIVCQRMLSFMEYCVENKIKGIGSNLEWCNKVGVHANNLDSIRKNKRSFSKEQLHAAGKVLGADLNYFFGLSNAMFKTAKKESGLQLLKQAVRLVESELREK